MLFRWLGYVVAFHFALTAWGAKCADLAQPVELATLNPDFIWDPSLKTFKTSQMKRFPDIQLTGVKFEDHATVKKLEKAINGTNGTFNLEISPLIWTGGKAQHSQFEIGARVLVGETRDFAGLPRLISKTAEGAQSVYGKITRESPTVILIENEYYLGGSTAYASAIRLKDGEIVNIEFRYPDTIEKSARYVAYKEHQTLCVKSYEHADIKLSE